MLKGEAGKIYRKLSEDTRKKLAKTPGVSKDKALAWINEATAPSDAELVGMYCGLIRADVSGTEYPEITDAMVTRWKVKRTYADALHKVAYHIRNAPGMDTLRAGVIVNEAGLSDQKTYIHKRLEQVHDPRNAPTLFRHGLTVAEVVEVAEAGLSQIDVLTKDQFQRALADSVKFFRRSGDDLTECLPPDDLTKYIYNSRDLPLPYLAALTRLPTMGENYRITTTPGYSLNGYVYYAPPADLDIPALPSKVTAEDLSEARRILVEEWLGDWPFDGWKRADLEAAALNGDKDNPPPPSLLNAVGFALEQVVRPIIKGPLPPTLFTKPTSRTGATMLVNAVQTAVSGGTHSMALTGDDEKLEKDIVAALRSSNAVVLIDNVSGEVDSPILAKWWTDPIFAGRELGKSNMLSLPVQHSTGITTNNATFSRELTERLAVIRLDARMAHPGQRTGFRHANILDWTRENRGRIIWALCVLALNWVQQGRPAAPAPTTWKGGPEGVPEKIVWGGYESYVEVVGGIVGAAAENWTTWQANRHLVDSTAYSGEDDPILELLTAWREEGGESIAVGDRWEGGIRVENGLAGIARERSISLPYPVKPVNRDTPFDYTPTSLGAWLAKYRDRPFEIDGQEWVLERSEKRGKRGHMWSLTELHDADEAPKAVAEPTAPEATPESNVTSLPRRARRTWGDLSDEEKARRRAACKF
ncbi:hypothetical protein [Acidimangrovimonas pyrenivorans]|uniref:Uncharacterized protein n=1 Tax=Acidimangrovimonas pyrenivorans TaxID=2030798 RepID=A0ABV7AKD8_9RHOB